MKISKTNVFDDHQKSMISETAKHNTLVVLVLAAAPVLAVL